MLLLYFGLFACHPWSKLVLTHSWKSCKSSTAFCMLHGKPRRPFCPSSCLWQSPLRQGTKRGESGQKYRLPSLGDLLGPRLPYVQMHQTTDGVNTKRLLPTFDFCWRKKTLRHLTQAHSIGQASAAGRKETSDLNHRITERVKE